MRVRAQSSLMNSRNNEKPCGVFPCNSAELELLLNWVMFSEYTQDPKSLKILIKKAHKFVSAQWDIVHMWIKMFL